MIDLRPDLLQSVLDLLAQHVPGLEVRAFGSRVKWTAKEHSDLDLVVMSPTPLPSLTLARLEEAFAESDLPVRVDVLDWAALSESFRRVIEQGYEVIQHGTTGVRPGIEEDFIDTEYGYISTNFDYAPLADLVVRGGVQTGPFGSQLHAEDYVEAGTPIITVEHLGENRIIHSDLPKVSDDDRKRLSRFALQTGDIVFSRVGSVDRRAIVHAEEDGWLFSGRCLRVRPDKAKIDNGYLSYFFGAPAFKEHIRKIAVGATMPSLNTKILGSIRVFFPPLPEQRAIAAILGALDDKIELNRRMNRTLEEMAAALFKAWFVDSAEAKGWETGSVKELGEVITGKTPPTNNRENYNGEIPFITIPDMHGKVFVTETGKTLSEKGVLTQGNKTLPSFSICVSCIATPGLVSITVKPSQTNQQINSLIPRDGSSNYYCYFALRNLAEEIRARGSGGSVVINLNKGQFELLPVVIPPLDRVHEFQTMVEPFFMKLLLNEHETQTLARLRDALLPKLISGELRVQDAERFVKEAV